MKNVFLSILSALFLTFASAAFAQSDGVPQSLSLEGLTAEQAKSIQDQVAQAKRKAAPELTTMDKAVELGRIIGSGLVATAKELGIAANEFAKSDLGKVVMYILIWKYLGQDILGVMIGIPFLIAGITLGLHLLRSAALESATVEYAHTPVLWGMFTVKRVSKKEMVKRNGLADSEQVQQVVAYVIIFATVAVSMAVIF